MFNLIINRLFFLILFSCMFLKMSNSDLLPIFAGLATITGLAVLGFASKEHYGDDQSAQYQTPPQFYKNKQGGNPLNSFRSPNHNMPARTQQMGLSNGGDQLLSYQLYQQSTNASVPTIQQLNSISGQSQDQTENGALEGGLSSTKSPYALLNDGGPQMYASEFQAVNLGSERAQSISACAQNAPTFVATSLLPKPSNPGEQSWDVDAPNNILANQNFLSAVQQMGVDTVLGSTRNQSYDIRDNIPNPINVVSPWNMTSILPDLEKRPLSCFVPQGGMYGCNAPGSNVNGTYVGQ
jgi:hypothetical protein